jgi:hypothetical protein
MIVARVEESKKKCSSSIDWIWRAPKVPQPYYAWLHKVPPSCAEESADFSCWEIRDNMGESFNLYYIISETIDHKLAITAFKQSKGW